jgi:DNA-binding response OmpR family regulator
MVMNSKRVIIISAVEKIRDFFELEALNFNFSVDSYEKFSKIHNDLSSYDLAIIDVDTIRQSPLNSAKKQISVSSQGKKADISYPCAISELQNIYCSLYFTKNISEKNGKDEKIKIVFHTKENNLISINKRKYILSDTEYKILTELCKNAQKILLRKDLQGLFDNEKSNIADVYICKLRKKLEEPLGQRLIFTVRNKGYKIIAEAEWR